MIKCDVCGIGDDEIEILKAKKFNICAKCVKSAYSILYGEEVDKELKSVSDVNLDDVVAEEKAIEEVEVQLSPKEIKAKLDEFVIGQEDTKKVLSVAVFNHFQRINGIKDSNIVFDKSNTLLIGPSGSGKTLLAKTIAKTFNVPIAITDATSLTQAGYTGDDVEGLLTRLVQNADGDIKKAEHGIIFIDEFDKIAKASKGGSGSGKDVGGEGVQQSLLKIIEGADVSFPLSGSRKNSNEPTGQINTENILFIASGAFSNLPNIINNRLNKKKAMGFDTLDLENKEEVEEILEHVEIDDLIEFGFIPEILGRLPVISTLRELTKDELFQVLTEPKNSIIYQYQELLKLNQTELSFSKKALDLIVDSCIENKTGVRNLKSSIEKIMLDIVFNIEDFKNKKITITDKYINSLNLSDLESKDTLIFNEVVENKVDQIEPTDND